MRTLVIEDDARLQRLLRRGLTEEGFDVDVAADGECALDLARTATYDAIVLDLMIPRISGSEVLRTLRKERRRTPILILTARDAAGDKVAGLDAGADDYLTKPFVFAELVARLRALVRRSSGIEGTTIRVGDLEIDTAARRAKRAGRVLTLRAKEWDLLEFLALRQGTLVTRAQIHDRLFGKDSDTLDATIDVHLSRLRTAIDRGSGKPLIKTVRGQGYRLEAEG
jgi:two-component system, OmpR family, response regulator